MLILVGGHFLRQGHALQEQLQELFVNSVDFFANLRKFHGAPSNKRSNKTAAVTASATGTGPMGDTGIMPAPDGQAPHPPWQEETVCWGREMDGVGLTARRSVRGMPLVMPPRMPPAWLVVRDHAAVGDDEGVVVGRAAGPGGGKAGAELHALDGGNAEEGRCQSVLHAVEHGPAQSGGKSDGGALDDAAHRIPASRAARMADCIRSPAASFKTGKGFAATASKSSAVGRRGKRRLPCPTEARRCAPTKIPRARICLAMPPAMQRGRQAAGEVAAAPHVRLASPT